MKLGFPKARMRNVAGATMGADLAAREWAGQRAVYESSQQMFSSIADTLSKREKRKSMLQYQDTVSQANRLLDSGDELTLADIEDIIDPSLLDEETRNYALANEGRVPTWKVQGQILSAVMEQAAEKATQGISIPAERDAFNDQLREQNIRVLEASMADAATKKEVWEKKDALTHITQIQDPAIKLRAIDDHKDRFEPQELEAMYKSAQTDLLNKAVNSAYEEAVASGNPDTLLEYADWVMNESSKTLPYITEKEKRAQARFLRSQANSLTVTTNPDNVNELNFQAFYNENKLAIKSISAAVDAGVDAGDLVQEQLARLNAMSEALTTFDPNKSETVTKSSQLETQLQELSILAFKDQINDSSYAELTAMTPDNPLEIKAVEEVIANRQNQLSLRHAQRVGLFGGGPVFDDPQLRQDYAEFMGVAAEQIPYVDENTTSAMSAQFEAGVLTVAELVGSVNMFNLPGFAEQLTGKLGDLGQAAASMVPDAELQARAIMGLNATDYVYESTTAYENLNDEITARFAEEYGNSRPYMQMPDLFTNHKAAVRGLVKSGMDIEDAMDAVALNTAAFGMADVPLPPNVNPSDFEDYIDEITANDVMSWGRFSNSEDVEEVLIALDKGFLQPMPDFKGFIVGTNPVNIVRDDDNKPLIIPFGDDEQAGLGTLDDSTLSALAALKNILGLR